MNWANGEVKTQARIQDEAWYSDYQAMMEMTVRNDYGAYQDLLREFEEDFISIFGRAITPEEHLRFDRWAKYEWEVSQECLLDSI